MGGKRAPHNPRKPPEPSHEDIAIEFPAALDELERSSAHVSERLALALVRSRKRGATGPDLHKIKALANDLKNMIVDLDEIGGSEPPPPLEAQP